jgi:chromosome segregation ATPase
MRTSEQRFNDSSRAMQKALVLKSDDLVQTTNKLAHISAKYDRESRQWVHDKRTLRDQLMGLGQDFVSLEAKFENRNQLMEAGNHQRQELAERVVLREQDLGRYSKSLREKDMQLKSEMEARSLAEIQSRQREDNYNRMAVELKELKDMYERRTNDVKDLEVIKKSFSECKRELSDVTHREKNYLLEIEQLSVRERKLYAESEELSTTQRKNFNETSRLNTKISGLIQEIEIMKNVDVNLRNEIKECSEKSLKSIEENKELTDLIRQARNENNRLMRDLSDSQSALRESSISNSNIHEEIKKLQISEQLLKNERDNQNAQLSSISSVLQQKREEIDGYSRKVSELTIDLQNEISEKDNLRNMNKDKLAGVSDRISELQSTLQSTTLQMQELQQNEVQYRQVVRTKDDSIRLKSQQVSELQDTVRDLQKEISTATIEMQDVKTIKREEFLTLQDKFAQAKLSMQQEVLTLRDSLTKKTSQLVTASDELNKLKQGLNEFSADRFTLESRLSELMSSESSYQRQVANFQMQIHTKNQELQRTFAKQQAFEDQIKILEEEVKVYRNGRASNDGDIQRLQNNMQQLSKRLKNQVDVLLEKDEITTPNHLRSPSSESQGGRYSLSTTLRKPVLNVRIADDYDNIDRLLAKSPQTLSQI